MEPLDTQDYDELIELVGKAKGEEIARCINESCLPLMIAGRAIGESPTTRLVNLNRLEMKLIGLRDAKYVFDNKPRPDTLEEV